MRVRHVMVTVLLLFISGNAAAGRLAYTCEVISVYTLSENGTLQTSGFERQMKASTFSVSRITGEIIGEVIPTLLSKSMKVVNKGSPENSFKAVADFGDQFQILEIQEFRSDPIKPFIATSMGGAGIITGTCK